MISFNICKFFPMVLFAKKQNNPPTPSSPQKKPSKTKHVKTTKTKITLSAVKRPIKVQGRQKLWKKQDGIFNIHV